MSAENYVAWLRFTDRGTITLCDSDAEGAFRVYRFDPAAIAAPELLRTLRYVVLNAGSPNYDKTKAERAFKMLLDLENRCA